MKYVWPLFLFIPQLFAIDIAAHRGASGYLPEHTLEAYTLAHSFGVDYIEPDVVMTKDNELVLMHDHHLDTTTNVKEVFPKRKRKDGRYYVVDFTLAEIKKLKVQERFNPKNGKQVYPDRFSLKNIDFKVPTLKEFIELIQGLNKTRDLKIGIIPEIKKPEFHLKEKKDITRALIEVLRAYGYENNNEAIIQSFWPDTLKRLKEEFKTKISLLQLVAKNSWKESSFDYDRLYTNEGLTEVKKYADIISYPLSDLFEGGSHLKVKSLVDKVKGANLKLYAYTYRREELPRNTSENIFLSFLMKEVKLDGLFSDYPDRAVLLRKELE